MIFRVVYFNLIACCFILWQLTGLFATRHSARSNDSNHTDSVSPLDKIFRSAKSRRSSGKTLDVLRKDGIDFLERIQGSMSDRSLECMPGSVFYNGTCIFISSKRQKLPWVQAERFCRKLPLNTTFLLLQNNHKYEFIKNEIIKLREKENPMDQLVFFIGFRFMRDEWKWTNNQTLGRTNLSLGRYWWDWSGSHGDCGSIALLKNNELVMRSAPCLSTSNRFICEYNLNPCFKNDVCGPHGKCVNLYFKFYCDCSSSVFYEGKYCEKFNLRGIQVVVAVVILSILFFGILCNTDRANEWWHYQFGKEKTNKQKTKEEDDQSEKDNEYTSAQYTVEAGSKSAEKGMRQISKKIVGFGKKIKHYLGKLRDDETPYFILFFLTAILTVVQITFTHNYFESSVIKASKQSHLVNVTCQLMNDYYLFEDLIYLPLSLFFLLFLYLFIDRRRFNNFIMVKYSKRYFKTSIFKSVQKEYKEKRDQQVKQQLKDLEKKTCGPCRVFSYKCFSIKIIEFFCCLFCCSCCVPQGSNTRCFMLYCCCLGWRQTDFYKILKTIQNVITGIFYYGLLCPVWTRLWKITKIHREERKRLEKEKRLANEKERRLRDQQRRNKAANKSNISSEIVPSSDDEKEKDEPEEKYSDIDESPIDLDNEFDINDYDPKNQAFTRKQGPFPSTPFSTSNRALSAAVYIIYTYDVLNIFIYVFTGSINFINLPFFGNIGHKSGVIVELIIQSLHVIIIGIKFYPILVVADLEPNMWIYFVSLIYVMFIWLSSFFKKAFCNQTEAFIKRAFKQYSNMVADRLKTTLQRRVNVTDTLMGLFTDTEKPSETYFKTIKEKVPQFFREIFGKYDPNENSPADSGVDDIYLFNTLNGNEFDTNGLNNYYLMNDQQYVYSPIRLTTTTLAPVLLDTSSQSFRSMLKNKTMSGLAPLKTFFFGRDPYFNDIVNIFENIPLYITISYLVVKYGMMFLSSLIDGMKKPSVQDPGSIKSDEETIVTLEACDKLIIELDKNYVEKDDFTETVKPKKNHNYTYITRILKNTTIYSRSHSKIHTTSGHGSHKGKQSYPVALFRRVVYQNVPDLKFSKMFVNTYVVAFMIIYFFTLFGLRLSNIFGDVIIGSMELIYKLVFESFLPGLNVSSHNFNMEFRVSCILTSLVLFYQMFESIKTFRNDLQRLHRGEKFFTSIVLKYKDEDYTKLIRRRNKESFKIASDSLHFPGYFIAHLVYGYGIQFVILFVVVAIFKFLYYFPGAFQTILQFLLPIIILLWMKSISITYLLRTVFLRTDSQRITNQPPFYVLSYFSFFFDCFLGLFSCMNRVWQTTLVSIFQLARLDKSIFGQEQAFLGRKFDRGHMAYLNYVRMEHWYNNPVLSGFCEMLIESMFRSQIYKKKFDYLNLSNQKSLTRLMSRELSIERTQRLKLETEQQQRDLLEKQENYQKRNTITFEDGIYEDMTHKEDEKNLIENLNDTTNELENFKFDYDSFRRLRNIIFLCLLLRKNPLLKKYRNHYLKELKSREAQEKLKQVESKSEFLARSYNTLKNKFDLMRFFKSNTASIDSHYKMDESNNNTFRNRRKNLQEINSEDTDESNSIIKDDIGSTDLTEDNSNTITIQPPQRYRRSSL